MRAVVNGKLYDTETTNLVASHEHVEVGFLFFIRQQLYITRDGEYFLFGQPGGDSRYRYEEAPRKWVAGWRIDPISYDEAREWLKANMNADYHYERLSDEVTRIFKILTKLTMSRKTTMTPEKTRGFTGLENERQREAESCTSPPLFCCVTPSKNNFNFFRFSIDTLHLCAIIKLETRKHTYM